MFIFLSYNLLAGLVKRDTIDDIGDSIGDALGINKKGIMDELEDLDMDVR